MWIRALLIFFLMIGGMLEEPAHSYTAPEYWLCYRKNVYAHQTYIGLFYLVKFDAAGRVVMQPTEIAKEMRHASVASICLAPGRSGNFNLWLSATGDDSRLYRVEIDRRTLNTKRIVTMQEKHIVRILSTDRNKNENFLVVNDRAIALDSNGVPGARQWPLVDPLDPENPQFAFSLAADGSAVLLGLWDRIFHQRLDQTGVPAATPVLVARRGYGYDRPDSGYLSNSLPGGRRILATRRIYESSHDCGDVRIVTQVINAVNAKPLEKKHVVATGDYECEAPALVSLDPHGKFLLYLTYDLQLPHQVHAEGIAFQALDALGGASDRPAPLLVLDDAGSIYHFSMLED